MTAPPIPDACPLCTGELYDNRARKAAGGMKPNAPDFKCKNATCGWLQWPRDKGTTTPAAKPVATDPWPGIHAVYGRCENEATKTLTLSGVDPTSEHGMLLLATLTDSYIKLYLAKQH